jgi:U3 small nucleolar RNA-associated protein 6
VPHVHNFLLCCFYSCFFSFRTIVKKRKEFEYKIQRRTKCKEDYLRYIQYEIDLLKLTRLRREVSLNSFSSALSVSNQ